MWRQSTLGARRSPSVADHGANSGDVSMRTAFAVIVILASAAIAVGGVVPAMTDVGDSATERRAAVAFVGEPVAVITGLPAKVSNGTAQSLDGSDSYDFDGSIANYAWKISVAGTTSYQYGISVTYTFLLVEIYTIELTVTDNESKTGKVTQTVESVIDSDIDGLPDWWERTYFGNLNQGPEGDYDSDGYLNAEELVDGTDPTHKDPAPSIFSKIPIWGYAGIVAAAAVAVFLVLRPIIQKKQKEREQKKIQYALEIEKALEEEK